MDNVLEMSVIGKQTEGESPGTIKEMAIRALQSLGNKTYDVVADIGAGRGDLTRLLAPFANKIWMADDFENPEKLPKAQFVKVDLNDNWAIEDDSIDFAFSLEVIEHIENPRHFMREMKRIIKPGGYGFVSTPNNQNIFSRINFFFNSEHRWFKDFSYPAHISVLTKKDFTRILSENDLEFLGFHYNYADTMPLTEIPIRLKVGNLSSSMGVLFRKK